MNTLSKNYKMAIISRIYSYADLVSLMKDAT